MKPVSYIFVLLLFGCALTAPLCRVSAQQSEQYKIESGTILQDSNEVAQSADPVQTNDERTSRISKDGFSAFISDTPIRFSVAKTIIDYGSSPTNGHVVKDTPVKIMYTGDGGFALLSGTSKGESSDTVFKTTGCSLVRFKGCFASYSRLWDDENVFGYGYSMMGDGISQDFLGANYFRPFANAPLRTGLEVVAQGQGQAKDNTFILRTKLNEDGEKQGTFSNTIYMTALQDW